MTKASNVPKRERFGDVLRDVSDHHGFARNQLAARLGVSRASVTRWMFHVDPPPMHRRAIVYALRDVHPDLQARLVAAADLSAEEAAAVRASRTAGNASRDPEITRAAFDGALYACATQLGVDAAALRAALDPVLAMMDSLGLSVPAARVHHGEHGIE